MTVDPNCPVCHGVGWASQWRTYGHAEMHGYYFEPCDACRDRAPPPRAPDEGAE